MSTISSIRITNGKAYVAVMRGQDDKQPWLVVCGVCKPGFGGLFAWGDRGGSLSLASTVAWAPTWGVAQAWASVHVAEHEQHRCPTCSHLPAEKVDTRVNAHLRKPTTEHWLLFDDDRKVTGCHCGFTARESDSGYGDSVVEHLLTQPSVRQKERPSGRPSDERQAS